LINGLTDNGRWEIDMNAAIENLAVRATPREAERDWLFLEAPAKTEHARRMRHALADFLHRHGWSEDDVDVLSLAVGEACNNAVSYSPPDTVVSLCAELIGRSQLQVEIRNPGTDFIPDSANLTDLPEHEATHGRGFPLMHCLMDEVHVKREGDDIVVRLIKRLPA